MIRKEAAAKAARDILGPYVKHGMADEGIIALAALVIMAAVWKDELKQQAEAMENDAAEREAK